MYQVSRSIYRELAPDILEDRHCDGPSNHERVLHACEQSIHRLATDRFYFAHPARTLFNEVVRNRYAAAAAEPPEPPAPAPEPTKSPAA